MKKKKISQYKLIKEYGVSTGQLDRLRKNDNVSTFTLNQLCRILNCQLEDIAEYVDEWVLFILLITVFPYRYVSKNSTIPAFSTLHSRPTFTAGSSSFAIILRICWRVVWYFISCQHHCLPVGISPENTPSYPRDGVFCLYAGNIFLRCDISVGLVRLYPNPLQIKIWCSQLTEQISTLQPLPCPAG